METLDRTTGWALFEELHCAVQITVGCLSALLSERFSMESFRRKGFRKFHRKFSTITVWRSLREVGGTAGYKREILELERHSTSSFR